MVKMTVAGLRVGQKVRSLSGRDRGLNYLIIGFEGDHLLLLANGKGRTLSRPKKKNTRHVEISLWVDRDIEERLNSQKTVTDEEIRASLHRWENESEEG
jgi:ribosomal protein L14E/L6E/L27E